jgi:hypothetical protein
MYVCMCVLRQGYGDTFIFLAGEPGPGQGYEDVLISLFFVGVFEAFKITNLITYLNTT